jgi:non-haem Fe2+, alpha-ketoglutarate-dependent halogenase
VLDDAQVERYHRDGVLFPVPVLSDDKARRYAAAYLELAALLGGDPRPQITSQCHLNFRWAYELTAEPAILEVIEQILGPNILVHSTTVFCKQPQSGVFVSYHQDGWYWQLEPPALVSAWVSLGESSDGNGCMKVIPGTHRRVLDHEERIDPENLLGNGITVCDAIDESRALSVVLRAGEMSLHHPLLIHGSQPNRSERARIGFAIRYVAPEARQVSPHHEVLLVRGRNTTSSYVVAEPPPEEPIAAGLGRQVAFAERLRELQAKSRSAHVRASPPGGQSV